MEYLIDTNILIYHLNDEEAASSFLKRNKDNSAISFITYVEVLSYNYTEDEEQRVKRLLNRFHQFSVNNEIITDVIKTRRTKKIKIPDAIILATANLNNLTLVTRNIKDFNTANTKLFNPFE